MTGTNGTKETAEGTLFTYRNKRLSKDKNTEEKEKRGTVQWTKWVKVAAKDVNHW